MSFFVFWFFLPAHRHPFCIRSFTSIKSIIGLACSTVQKDKIWKLKLKHLCCKLCTVTSESVYTWKSLFHFEFKNTPINVFIFHICLRFILSYTHPAVFLFIISVCLSVFHLELNTPSNVSILHICLLVCVSFWVKHTQQCFYSSYLSARLCFILS